jgi:hypothetical protein
MLLLMIHCGWACSQQVGLETNKRDRSLESAFEACRERIRTIREDAGQSSESQAQLWNDLELVLEWHPSQRHRFLVPERAANVRAANSPWSKLWERPADWIAFKESIRHLVNSCLETARHAEEQGRLEFGFRLRCYAVGLEAFLEPQAKPSQRDRWSHSAEMEIVRSMSKATTNHPKLLWPAGSYALLSTTHFDIASQVGTKPTEEVAEICERTFCIWKQLFYRYWATSQVSSPYYRLVDPPRFSVAIFRDRAAYMQALRNSERNIAVSTGYYDPNRNIAMFFWDGSKTLPTIVHELTHQFFFEAGANPVLLNSDRDPGYWVIEGIALYLESMSTRSLGNIAMVDVGGWDAARFQAGRYRRLHDGFWIPWESFHSATGSELRRNPDVSKWYSQATGLAHFWMDGPEEQQNRLIDYIEGVYQGNEDTSRLGELTDEALRKDYDRFLILGPSLSGTRPFFANRKDVVLARCDMQSEALLRWPASCRSLEWFDVSFCPLDDSLFMDGNEVRQPPWKAVRLNLESTRITDLSMRAIAAMKELKELDLSNCKITDEGLQHFRNHAQLKTLWLSQTKVTDASIAALMTMPQLEQLHVQGTEMSEAKWKQLLKDRPRMQRGSTGPK